MLTYSYILYYIHRVFCELFPELVELHETKKREGEALALNPNNNPSSAILETGLSFLSLTSSDKESTDESPPTVPVVLEEGKGQNYDGVKIVI